MMTDQEYEAILNDTSLLSSNGQPILIIREPTDFIKGVKKIAPSKAKKNS